MPETSFQVWRITARSMRLMRPTRKTFDEAAKYAEALAATHGREVTFVVMRCEVASTFSGRRNIL